MKTIPNKPSIFGIGLSRTGTLSLAKALTMLGYDACHWPCSMQELQAHQAVTDVTVSCRFKILDKEFPGGRFIYTIRDKASWLKSCRGHWERIKEFRGTPTIPPFAEQAEIAIYNTLEFNEKKLLNAYRSHHESVMDYFNQRRKDLLVLNIIKGDGWDKLCPFLQKPVPSAHFPHHNCKPR